MLPPQQLSGGNLMEEYKYAFILTFNVKLAGLNDYAICDSTIKSNKEELYYSQINYARKQIIDDFLKNGYNALSAVLTNCIRTLND